MTTNNIQNYQMFIDGQWIEAENNQRFESTNPENNKPWSSFPDATVNDINNAVAAAKNAFKSWSESDVKKRAQYLRAIGDQLKNNAEYIARHPTSMHKIPLGTAQVLLYPFSFLKSGRLTILFHPGPPGLVFL